MYSLFAQIYNLNKDFWLDATAAPVFINGEFHYLLKCTPYTVH